MGEVFHVKLIKVGRSVGFIVPHDQLILENLKVGDLAKVALLKHKK